MTLQAMRFENRKLQFARPPPQRIYLAVSDIFVIDPLHPQARAFNNDRVHLHEHTHILAPIIPQDNMRDNVVRRHA
jgi:hypothetical protein